MPYQIMQKGGSRSFSGEEVSEEASLARFIALKQRLAFALTAFDEGKFDTVSNAACPMSLGRSLCIDPHGCRLGLAGSRCTETAAADMVETEEASWARLTVLKQRLAAALKASDGGKFATKSNGACKLSLGKSLCTDSQGCRLGLARSRCTATAAAEMAVRVAFAREGGNDTAKVVIQNGGPAYIWLPACTEGVCSTNDGEHMANNNHHVQTTAHVDAREFAPTCSNSSSPPPTKLCALKGWRR